MNSPQKPRATRREYLRYWEKMDEGRRSCSDVHLVHAVVPLIFGYKDRPSKEELNEADPLTEDEDRFYDMMAICALCYRSIAPTEPAGTAMRLTACVRGKTGPDPGVLTRIAVAIICAECVPGPLTYTSISTMKSVVVQVNRHWKEHVLSRRNKNYMQNGISDPMTIVALFEKCVRTQASNLLGYLSKGSVCSECGKLLGEAPFDCYWCGRTFYCDEKCFVAHSDGHAQLGCVPSDSSDLPVIQYPAKIQSIAQPDSIQSLLACPLIKRALRAETPRRESSKRRKHRKKQRRKK